ncbi:hypothetical protein AAHC03_05343 [Spirometra sp. Aus1]
MSLGSFGDLGKAAEDVLTKHFKNSFCNFVYKSKTENNVDVHVECNGHNYQTTAFGDLTFRPFDGISVNTKINDTMKLTSDIEISEKIRGMKHNVVCSIDKAGEKNLKLKSCLKQDHVNSDIEVDFASKFPCTVGSIVVGGVDYGFAIGWDGRSKTTSFGAAVMYKPNKDTFLKARLTERWALALAYGVRFMPGALLTVSVDTDTTYRATNYGMCLEIEK